MSQNFSNDRHENRVKTELQTYQHIIKEEVMPAFCDSE
jgi:hypothetical protein